MLLGVRMDEEKGYVGVWRLDLDGGHPDDATAITGNDHRAGVEVEQMLQDTGCLAQVF